MTAGAGTVDVRAGDAVDAVDDSLALENVGCLEVVGEGLSGRAEELAAVLAGSRGIATGAGTAAGA